MSPDTVHRIAQEIRQFRGILTSEEKWLRSQPHSTHRIEGFRRINFWRKQLEETERKIASGEVHKEDDGSQG